MAIMLIEKDPFVGAIGNLALIAGEGGTDVNVRRPLFGAGITKETFAFLSVRIGEHAIALVDSSAPGGFSTTNHNFIVQTLSQSRQEKVQVIETFGQDYVFFYGEKPQVIQVQGMLLGTNDFNWKREWLHNYDKYLRGTKCVELKARVYLGVDDQLFSGYIMNTQLSTSSENRAVIPFSFSMLVTDNTFIVNPAVVKNAEETRSYTRPSDTQNYLTQTARVEYLTKTKRQPGVRLDTYLETGEVTENSMDVDAPATLESSRTAQWLSPVSSNPTKQYYEAEEASREIGLRYHMQKEGVSRFEALQAEKEGNTPLSTRSDLTGVMNASLGTGIKNGIGVV